MKTTHSTLLSGVVIGVMALVLSLTFVSCGKSSEQTDRYSFYENTVESGKPLAFGDNRDLYVFCDEINWKALNPALQESLEREVQLVVKEHYFTVKRARIQDINELIKYKNLLFIGDLDTRGAVSRHIASTLPEQMTTRIKSTGGDMFVASNRWVKDQLVVYLVGKDEAGLANISKLQAENLYSAFVGRLGERLAYQTYQTKVIQPAFFDAFPFSLKIPENYKLFSDDKQGKFLSFLYRIGSEDRTFPDKYISVYRETIPAEKVNKEWAVEKRAYIARKYFEGDEFTSGELNAEQITFGKYPAWKISGAWKNTRLAIGGAFQSIAFYVPEQKQAYLIDNSVYFPAGDKLPILLELQKVSETFSSKQSK